MSSSAPCSHRLPSYSHPSLYFLSLSQVNEADADGDGEVSFEEFEGKVAQMIHGLTVVDGAESVVGQASTDKTHWQSLSRLISHFSEDDDENGVNNGKDGKPAADGKAGKGATGKKRRGMMNAMHISTSGSTEAKKKMQKRKVAWNQHDAMVAHFNLRRLSMGEGGNSDEDDISAAIRIVAEQESRMWKHRLKRPM